MAPRHWHNDKRVWYACHLCDKVEELTTVMTELRELFEELLVKMDELIEATQPGPS